MLSLVIIIGPELLLYLILVAVTCEYKAHSLSAEVAQKTAVRHVGHHEVGGGATVHTDANEAEHIGMLEVLHESTLAQ